MYLHHIDDDMRDATYTRTDTDTCGDVSNGSNEIRSSVDYFVLASYFTKSW
jgi:hypothetical protein